MPEPQTFSDIVLIFVRIIRAAIPPMIAVAVLVFFFGIIKFIYRSGGGDEKAMSEGRQLMIWGLIALFVLVSIWGILRFLYASLGFSGEFRVPFLP